MIRALITLGFIVKRMSARRPGQPPRVTLHPYPTLRGRTRR